MNSDVTFAKPFISATSSVLSTMAGITPVPGTPFVKKDDIACGDVSAIIGLTGEKHGSISVTFTKKCAVALVRAMLGDDIQDIIADTKDAVGEICNMISGQARAGLSEMGFKFDGSTPSIIMGDAHTVTHVTASPVIAVPFTTDHGEFTIEFSFG
ncbi:chemotaxis protein CheX [Halodesulfovibrio spirochaetisodalis]|uniref:Chemotaxis protein CheX n=1 Tax=Halodesulfovibrio spirochaetisodalis TaxID=1560234 RepID=A0A1B7XH63_9BACT|nr:chemotaxis protein CheX [Halodesulfovibrio spirochaetisodalis]OBQ54838.1 chemotaxis protein CheX [Halodesulfovibrio spirochaetisodalis]